MPEVGGIGICGLGIGVCFNIKIVTQKLLCLFTNIIVKNAKMTVNC